MIFITAVLLADDAQADGGLLTKIIGSSDTRSILAELAQVAEHRGYTYDAINLYDRAEVCLLTRACMHTHAYTAMAGDHQPRPCIPQRRMFLRLLALTIVTRMLQKGAASQLPAEYEQVVEFAEHMTQHPRYRTATSDPVAENQMQTLRILLVFLRVVINWTRRNVAQAHASIEVTPLMDTRLSHC